MLGMIIEVRKEGLDQCMSARRKSDGMHSDGVWGSYEHANV